MPNWKGFWNSKLDGVYDWMPVSEAFYRLIKNFTNKDDKILECGSSTGHISYRLAKEGYNVTLLDIRREPIEIARNNFEKHNVRAQFVCANIFDHHGKYDLVWNSGLIQCYDEEDKAKLLNKLADITSKVLLFYPDTENPNKKRGANEHEVPGLGNAKEYGIKRIPEIVCESFNEINFGIMEKNKIGLEYSMYWICARNV